MDTSKAPEISKVMTLSTAHIPEKVAQNPKEHTTCTPAVRYEGFLVATYPAGSPFSMYRSNLHQNDLHTHPHLLECMKFARKYGCAYILFDRDGPVQPELPTYYW